MAAFPVKPLTVRDPALGLFTVLPQVDFSSSAWNIGTSRNSSTNSVARWRCHTLYKPGTQDYNLGLAQNQLPLIDWKDKSSEPDDRSHLVETPEKKVLHNLINEVKGMLSSMGDGEISVSAYDTAWVALVRQINEKDGPQFPSSLKWIAANQLHDGSWGDPDIFSAHDRMINTLACVIALKSWRLCPEQCQKGLVFLYENMWRIGEEDATLMPIGFEIAFPSLMEIAQELGLELPYSDTALQSTYAKRNLKLKRIPREVLHKVPTTLLHSLEGFASLDWDRLLKLQCFDGSFLFSPAATAHALEQTGDKKCLQYLEKIVQKFNGGVPNVYPVDLFEHVWVVDRLERLGIARYFESEIRDCMSYVNQYWNEVGICWARNSAIQDVDDTAMGFRLLRLHGYDVSPDVFRNFEKEGEFFCFVGQSDQAVTGMFNLNRATQVMYPGEDILDRAKTFSYKFLREKQSANQITDKWIISKDLSGEVEYGLDFPWYASLPRVEARVYLQQYGGGGDIWIGKTLYRMFYVNNDLYLELAKLDFNHCQSVHQLEWNGLQRWFEETGLGAHGVSQESLTRAYFLAASSIYEPERLVERLGWAQSTVLADAISSYLSSDESSEDKYKDFVGKFLNRHTRLKQELTRDCLVGALDGVINRLQSDGRHHLRQAWEEWLLTWKTDRVDTGLLVVRTIEACGGRLGSSDPTSNLAYHRLSKLTSSICHRLSKLTSSICHRLSSQVNKGKNGTTTDNLLLSEMQELVQCVFHGSDSVNNLSKQTFFTVARSYYYTAHCPPSTLEEHMNKVLFERVI